MDPFQQNKHQRLNDYGQVVSGFDDQNYNSYIHHEHDYINNSDSDPSGLINATPLAVDSSISVVTGSQSQSNSRGFALNPVMLNSNQVPLPSSKLLMNREEFDSKYQACWTLHFYPMMDYPKVLDPNDGQWKMSERVMLKLNKANNWGISICCRYCQHQLIITEADLGSTGNIKKHFVRCGKKPENCIWDPKDPKNAVMVDANQ